MIMADPRDIQRSKDRRELAGVAAVLCAGALLALSFHVLGLL
jgi:hypothetical protein